jgi:hypothetical protein
MLSRHLRGEHRRRPEGATGGRSARR